MKVIILAGGYGSRLSEYTDTIPKPMVEIGGKPILYHLMEIFSYFGHKDFYLALGYKSDVIVDFFKSFSNSEVIRNEDLSIIDNKVVIQVEDWNISLINTGDKSMTGGRLKRVIPLIGKDSFLATYGDGLSNIDLNKLLSFHKSHKKLVTISAVRPAARLGELQIKDSFVTSFKEKPQLKTGWINGGFFVMEPNFIDYLSDDLTVLEEEPLEKITKDGELMAYKHEGFWQCMDTKRDKDLLEEFSKQKVPPWNNR